MSEEVRQTGIVMKTEGETALVRFTRSDACGHCNACFTLNPREADIEIPNVLGAKEGDRVAIELHGKNVLLASLLMYGIPCVALVIGAVLGSLLGDVYAALGGVLFAAGTYFIFRGLEPKISKMGQFKPRMIEILPEGATQSEQCDQCDKE